MTDQLLEQRVREHLAQIGEELNGGPVPDVSTIEPTFDGFTSWLATHWLKALLVVGAMGVALTIGLSSGHVEVDDSDEPPRVVVSPWVDAAAALANPADEVLFSVRTDHPQSWRVVELETYEDGIWKTSGESVSLGQVPDEFKSFSARLESDPLRTAEFTVETDLHATSAGRWLGVWLPTIADPVTVESDDLSIVWMNGLVVGPDDISKSGQRYTVTAPQPVNPSSADLEAASDHVPESVSRKYGQITLSSGDAAVVATEVETVIAGTSNRAERIDLLLERLDSLTATPDGSIDPGATEEPVVALLESGRGSTRQFVSAFAVMARLADAPSRVVAGFGPGDPVEPNVNGTATFEVKSSHLEFWVEIYYDGIGWVRYDPVP